MPTVAFRKIPVLLLAVLALSLAASACSREKGPRMPAQEYEQLALEAVNYLDERQDSLEREYGLSKLRRPSWDQRTGRLTLSDSGKVALEADVQFVGSLSKTKNTWLWAWANPSVRDEVKSGAQAVRRYGERFGIPRLTEREWAAERDDAWEMTALAARILNARGAYRTEDRDGVTYLLLTSVRRPGESAADSAGADTVPPPAPAPAPKGGRPRRDSTAGAGFEPPQ